MPPNVLIVDDEPALNELFVIGLNKYGFMTEGVLGGQECLDLLSTEYRPDLILLDMMMEPMDGWETLNRLKKMDELREIPVIMQTGKNLTYKEAEQFSFCIEDYIMKPITPKRCIAHITATLEKLKTIEEITSKARSSGYSEEKIQRFVQLFRTIDVANKLLRILEDRYGTERKDPDEDTYGPDEYTSFLTGLQDDYNRLCREMEIDLAGIKHIT